MTRLGCLRCVLARLTTALLCGVLAGCATVTPMQTASVVSEGAWRLGGQLSAAAYCGALGSQGPFACSEYPDGAPLPELRLDARRGVGRRSDLGLSLQVFGQLFAPSRPVQLGLTFEGKSELLSVQAGPVHHLLSIGMLVGSAVSGRFELPPFVQLEVGLNLFYGLQTPRFEWVAGLSASQRRIFNDGPIRLRVTERLGLTLGLFRRAPAGWALQLGYFASPLHPEQGAFQIQYGLFWDFV